MFRISSRFNVIPKGAKGWIDPNGLVIPLGESEPLHGIWIKNNFDSLKKRYPDMQPIPDDPKPGMYDASRDFLISKGWINVFGIRDLQVFKLDDATKTNITDALLTHQLNLNIPARVYEKSTDGVYTLRQGENGEFLFSID